MTEPGKELEPANPRNQSLIQIKVGNKYYPMVKVKSCHTCMHPARVLIEERILTDHPFTAIAKEFSGKEIVTPEGATEVWPEISAIAIRNHYKSDHCPANAKMVREYSEELAQAAGKDYETAIVKPMANHILVRDSIITRGHERILLGEIEPDIKDVLSAIKLKAEMEKAEGQDSSQDVEVWQVALRIYMEEVQKILNVDQKGSLNIALRNNKELAELQSSMKERDKNNDR